MVVDKELLILARTSDNEELLKELADHKDLEVREELAKNPNLNGELIDYMVVDDCLEVTLHLLDHTNMKLSTVKYLFDRYDINKIAKIAQNPVIDEWCMNYIIKSGDVLAMSYLAMNKSMTNNIENKLIRTNNRRVYNDLIFNESLSIKGMEKLLNRSDSVMLNFFVKRDKIPETIMRRLVKTCVYPELVKRVDLSEQLVTDLVNGDLPRRLMIALSPSLNLNHQMKLAYDENAKVRSRLMSNKNLYDEVKKVLIKK